ncbi:MAG: PEGA domain-containing protein, partial [Bacteroidetes bacterium]|nr:PEGA domain-containing protein [Bacteroidota bacterium]
MKKYALLLFMALIGITFVGCDEDGGLITNDEPGFIFVSSIPSGAKVFLDGVNTNHVTPYVIPALGAGSYNVKLTLENFKDSTVAATVVVGEETHVNVTLTPVFKTFGPVRLWETTGTTASQPSGLDLSSGMAYGISSANKVDVDIYYDSNGFLVRSSS